jgi:hypothetical protein
MIPPLECYQTTESQAFRFLTVLLLLVPSVFPSEKIKPNNQGVFMKILIALALVISTSAMAATVKITSFNYVRSGEVLAELCGQVTDSVSQPSFVRVQIDHTSNRPASYNTLTDAYGKFCIAAVTYRGTAAVSLINQTSAPIEAFIR